MKLQEYNGYTVDYSVKQFRKCEGGWENMGQIEFIDFDSEKGRALVGDMIKEKKLNFGRSVCEL